MLFRIPAWFKQIDTDEKLIGILRILGREDLVIQFKTQGFLYPDEIFRAPIPDGWSDVCKSHDYIDFKELFEEEAQK